jgi:hypothetical protein
MATLENITHESGPPVSAHWNTVTDPGGRLSITNAAALNGTTNGLQCDFSTTNNADVIEPYTPPGSDELRLRFFFDPNSAGTPTVTSRNLIQVTLSEDGTVFGDLLGRIRVTKIITTGESRTFFIHGTDANPSGITSATTFDITDESHCFEIRVKRASSAVANDGEVEFFVDEVSKVNLASIDNFDLFPTIDNIWVRHNVLEAAMAGTDVYSDEYLLTDVEGTGLCVAVPALGLAAMTKPADIDAAGEFVYLALLDSGTPILTKISTVLDADGTTVFDPGAGDNIGVECGRFSSDTVWVAGNFDGTNVVEKSEDGGSSFTVKDDGTIGDVRSFVMGPDSDERILVFDETNGDILETRDDGASWDSINASVTPEINAIARLGENVQESVFGNDGAANDSVNYSVNSGDDLEDFQTGVYPNANATRVIVN